MDRLEEFKQFLIANDALEAYVENINRGIMLGLKHDAAAFILMAFTWNDTPQGGQFWEKLHTKWINSIFSKNFTASKKEIIDYLSKDLISIWED